MSKEYEPTYKYDSKASGKSFQEEILTYKVIPIWSNKIVVDETAQRDVEDRKDQFNKIMSNFNPKLVQPLTVADIDGQYFCIDGQMTRKVLVAINGGPVMINCRVLEGLTRDEAAELFLLQRGNSRGVSATDRIRVLLEHPNLTEGRKINFIEDICQKYNTSIGFKKDGTAKIKARQALSDELDIFDDNIRFEQMVRIFSTAWPKDIAGHSREIIKGLGQFIRTYEGCFDEDWLVERLAAEDPADLVASARINSIGKKNRGMATPSAVALEFVDCYNKRKKTNRLDIDWLTHPEKKPRKRKTS